ncbi:MAG: acid--CoA ligase [Flammeovirgaceae bacterium TMED32]|nr:acid--CoA ligase [Gammaproteobacteria bacterium]OUU00188.1 MAG: acid--CoA ligase [Flammeovirgaceae bacterium TMED32]RPG25152.1 MAG: acid--CoA ligase [Gammaproteobacteria bacterium TMED50]|tara:strand:- start:3950 stop:5407 length:1458 start_codon:yes stop_codon:yes gene_type:complete
MAAISISHLITGIAKADPDRIAITHEKQQLTRGQLDRRTNRLARDYQQRGVKAGDMVTVALPNSIAFYEACIATWKLGATPQPISARLPQIERQTIVELAEPAIVAGADPADHPDVVVLPVGYEPDASISDDTLPDAVSSSWKAPTSGGSTGRPKIIVAAEKGAFDFDNFLPLRQQRDRAQLVSGPLYHNAPFTFSMQGLMLGNHIIVMTRFDAEETLQLIERHRVDWMMMVPTMMLRIWKLTPDIRNRYDLSSLRIMLHLAAPCPPWLKEEWINWLGGDRVHELFGGTEGTGATWITGDEWMQHKGSVGRLMGKSQVKVVDAEGNDLPPGEVGEIYLLPAGGQGSTYRYIGAESKALDGGWESLGDMGYVDEEGYIYLSDRKTDMILSGGANLYPAEIEAALDAYPGIRSSAVIGLPDEDMGQLLHGIIDAPDTEIDDAELIEFLSERLVRYKIPRTFEFVTEPLRDDAGKTRRSALRAARVED